MTSKNEGRRGVNISLRWYDPDQVLRVSSQVPSAPPPTFFEEVKEVSLSVAMKDSKSFFIEAQVLTHQECTAWSQSKGQIF